MYCTHCGKELPNDAKFCLYCGKSTSAKKENNVSKTSNAPARHQPRCPMCGSTNLKRIGAGHKFMLLGGHPTKRSFHTFECLDCGFLI